MYHSAALMVGFSNTVAKGKTCFKEICNVQGIVVQNFVSLTLSLSPQFGNYMSTSTANALLDFVEKKCENPVQCIFFFNKK